MKYDIQLWQAAGEKHSKKIRVAEDDEGKDKNEKYRTTSLSKEPSSNFEAPSLISSARRLRS